MTNQTLNPSEQDLVVLNRNDVSDANYSITIASDRPDYPVFKSSTGIFHTYSENNSKWVECKSINDKTSGLKAVAVETIKVKGFEDLIDGKAALAAALAGEKVQISLEPWDEIRWTDFIPDTDDTSTKLFFTGFYDERKVFFRIKPKTITINGIEVPAPFSHRPEVGQVIFYLDDSEPQGFTSEKYSGLHDADFNYGWWVSEEKIKMVVDALRKVFEVQHD